MKSSDVIFNIVTLRPTANTANSQTQSTETFSQNYKHGSDVDLGPNLEIPEVNSQDAVDTVRKQPLNVRISLFMKLEARHLTPNNSIR